MKVEASPLAVSAFIQAALGDSRIRAQVEDQLESLGLDGAWLEALAGRYRRYWEFMSVEGGIPSTDPVSEQTVLLLSWLMRSLTRQEDATSLNQQAFVTTVEMCQTHLHTDLVAASDRISLTAGVVGRPVPVIDREFPAWLPGGMLDSNVELAYEGLVEHIAGAAAENWPEVHRTALLWRFGGIAQGLVGGDDELRDCLRQLNVMVSGALPGHLRKTTTEDWIKSFRSSRNIFTHVRSEGGKTFTAALSEYGGVEDLLDYLRLATFYVAININAELAQVDADRARRWADATDSDLAWVADYA